MSGWLAWFMVLTLAFWEARSEVMYKWDKTKILPQMGLNNWKATSFALNKDKVFLTLVDVEKRFSGNGVVGAFNQSKTMSPGVTIFPFQNFYKVNDPERGKITTPMTVRMDECERLWLLDSAVQNISGVQVKTPPGIYVFNTKNSQLIRSFNIPNNQWTSASFFVNFVIETENVDHDCEETYGYFADFNRFHLLVYDFLRNKSELKSHPFFSPDPLVHTPNEDLFNRAHQDLNGIFGLALTKYHSLMTVLYFHPLAATHEFRINTTGLKSRDNLKYDDVEIYSNKGENSESGASVFDPTTKMIFFAELNTKKIGSFKIMKEIDSKNPTYYRYDLKLSGGKIVDLAVHESDLWILVDDKSQIAIHKVPVAHVEAASSVASRHDANPPLQSSASHSLVTFTVFYFILFLFFRSFLISS